MASAYVTEGLTRPAVFELSIRQRAAGYNTLMMCGLEPALRALETLRFSQEIVQYLASLQTFSPAFLQYLAGFRFTGDLYAVPEGTPVFAGQPLVQVVAPLPQAQLVAPLLRSLITHQTNAASRACRLVEAAQGRLVVDLSLDEAPGPLAARDMARALYIGGMAATSNIEAGQVYGLPVTGTMRHSYVQAHASETEAFRAFVQAHPDTVLPVDTYDALRGVQAVIGLAGTLGAAFRVRAIRLDAGDLVELTRMARAMLDVAGLPGLQIFVGGAFTARTITELIKDGAAMDGIGIETGWTTDATALEGVYTFKGYADTGRRQVYRTFKDGVAAGDVLASPGEKLAGRPLLHPALRAGQRQAPVQRRLDDIRTYAASEYQQLPAYLRALEPAAKVYPVHVSPAVHAG